MRVFISFIFLMLFHSCNMGLDQQSDLDSLLHSEDSIRMSISLSQSNIDLKKINVSNDPDIDFSRLMLLFYQAELTASEIELREGSDPTILGIAKEQIAHHSKEISYFDNYSHTKKSENINPAFIHDFNKELIQVPENDTTYSILDKEYINLLISHHEKGIALCKVYLNYGTDTNMLSNARKIIRRHSQEIKHLRPLLSK